MNWNDIEYFLLHSIWGMIILGALGSLLFYLVLNGLGRANKGIRALWIFYKSGRDLLVEDGVKNNESYSFMKYVSQTILLFLLILISLDNDLDEKSGLFLRVMYWLRAFFIFTMLPMAGLLTSIALKTARKRIINNSGN